MAKKYQSSVSCFEIIAGLRSIITFPISDWCFGKITFLSMTETSKRLFSRVCPDRILNWKLSEVKIGSSVSLIIAVFLTLSYNENGYKMIILKDCWCKLIDRYIGLNNR